MGPTIEVLARKIAHPEGPDVLPDGRIVMVETYTGKIITWHKDDGISDYAVCDGGPNACLLGSDGAVYITQNGGTAGEWRSDKMTVAGIQRAWPDGSCEHVITSVAGIALQAPNDLSWGPDGRLYFTDPAEYNPSSKGTGRVFAVAPDGSGELLEEMPEAYPNGIAVDQDGSIVWVESFDGLVYRKRIGQASELLCQLPDGHIPDGLKIDENGQLWVTTVFGGVIDVLTPDGKLVESIPADGVPLNCLFHEGFLYVTDFGDIDHVPATAFADGRFTRIDVGVEGMPLFRGALD